MYFNLLRSSHKGPSRVPHWKPCTMLSFTEPRRALSTYNTQRKENRLFIESFSCQQVKYPSAQPLTKTDRPWHMQSRATSIFFFFPHTSDCLAKHTPNNDTPTHACQKILTHTSTFKWLKALFSNLPQYNQRRAEVTHILDFINLLLNYS